MNVLLDTHAFIWLDSSPEKLSPVVLQLCQNEASTLHLSMASVWEMQIKQQLGKLSLKLPLNQLIDEQCAINGLQLLPIAVNHIYALNDLPFHHKDPFDRLIIAQASIEQMSVVTIDEIFKSYDVKVLW